MNIKTLLAAASAVALLSTTAHAVEIDNQGDSGITFVQEIPAEDITDGNLVFNVDVTGGTSFGLQNGAEMTIVLPGGFEFSRGVAISDITAGGDAFTVNSAGILAGGADGDTSVLVSFNTDTDESSIGFSLPVQFDGCGNVGSPLAIAFRTANGAFIDGPPAVFEDILEPCVTFAEGTVTADGTITSLSAGSNFTALLGDNRLGEVSASITPGAALGIDASGLQVPLTPAEIASVTYDIVITNSAGIASVSGGTQVGTSDVFTSGTAIGAPAAPVDITVSSTVELDAKTAAVENGEITLVSSLNPTGSVEFSGSLEGVSREAISTGVFDWVSSTGTNSIFRITELPPGDTNMNVRIIDGHLNGVPVSGTYSGTVTANDAGEALLTSFDGFGVASVPDFTRADVELELELDPLAFTIDVDRLLVRNDQVFDFGDLNNNN